MSQPIQIRNKFNEFKSDFLSDTGLKYEDAKELYIHYYNARCNDVTTQIIIGLTNKLFNELDQFPGKLRLQLAEMIRGHEVIRDLINSLKKTP